MCDYCTGEMRSNPKSTREVIAERDSLREINAQQVRDLEALDTEVTDLREALDDLWGCIDHAGMKELDPQTITLARENHLTLWHEKPGELDCLPRDVSKVEGDVEGKFGTKPVFPGERCRFQTEWRGCNKQDGHSGAHYDKDSGIEWTGGMIYE